MFSQHYYFVNDTSCFFLSRLIKVKNIMNKDKIVDEPLGYYVVKYQLSKGVFCVPKNAVFPRIPDRSLRLPAPTNALWNPTNQDMDLPQDNMIVHNIKPATETKVSGQYYPCAIINHFGKYH